MNDQGKYTDDVLSTYVNPEMKEKAPEGFTARVMTSVRMESIPVQSAGKLRNRNLVPYLSAAVIVLLITLAFLVPGNDSNSFGNPVTGLFQNINFSVPQIDLSAIFTAKVPGLVIYVVIAIFVLSLFDRALSGLFHRQK